VRCEENGEPFHFAWKPSELFNHWFSAVSKYYGCKSGWCRYIKSLLAYRLGLLRHFRKIDWAGVSRLVFVCSGNICRSPYAEERAKSLGFDATSFGLNADCGSPSNPTAVRIACQHGVDLKGHRSRSAIGFVIKDGDLLIGMEPWHAGKLHSLSAGCNAQITLLGLWADRLRPHIEDPYGLSDEYFHTCFTLMDSAIGKMVSTVNSSKKPQIDPMDWRGECPVLVAEAQTIGAIGVIRSLGRSRYPVHACSPQDDALGFISNYASATAICPQYANPAFIPWLRDYVKSNSIQAIIPSESMLLAIRPAFSEFAHLLPFSRNEEVVFRGMSKFSLFEALQRNQDNHLSAHLPPTLLLENLDSLPSAVQLAQMELPIYIKTDGIHAKTTENGLVIRAPTIDKAYAELIGLRGRFRKAIIQGHVPGQGVGAFFLIWEGRVLAEFMHRRLHEVPHTGGVSSLRESWWHQGIRNDALVKLKSLNWQGVAMMEYRWDSLPDQFYLMEMNGRFWGSIHLALYAGVDFPRILLDAFHGKIPKAIGTFPLHILSRLTLPNDLQYVWSRIKDTELSIACRLRSVLEFFSLCLSPHVFSDLLFPGDGRLFRECFNRFLKDTLFQRLLCKKRR